MPPGGQGGENGEITLDHTSSKCKSKKGYMGSVGCTGELICDKGHIYPLKGGKKSKGVRLECLEDGGAEVGQWKAIDKNGQSSKLQPCIEGTYVQIKIIGKLFQKYLLIPIP